MGAGCEAWDLIALVVVPSSEQGGLRASDRDEWGTGSPRPSPSPAKAPGDRAPGDRARAWPRGAARMNE